MQFVAANTSIRVPRVIRCFDVPLDEDFNVTYIVMEYIRGTVLRDCWPDLSEPRRQKVCEQLVDAIAQLQTLQVERPGPIGGGSSKGPWFTFSTQVHSPPFASWKIGLPISLTCASDLTRCVRMHSRLRAS